VQILNVILNKVKNDKQYQQQQTILFEQNIPQMMLEILQLMYQMCFKKTVREAKEEGSLYNQSQFGIAQNNLNEAINSIWDFFLAYCQNNEPISQYLLQYDEVLSMTALIQGLHLQGAGAAQPEGERAAAQVRAELLLHQGRRRRGRAAGVLDRQDRAAHRTFLNQGPGLKLQIFYLNFLLNALQNQGRNVNRFYQNKVLSCTAQLYLPCFGISEAKELVVELNRGDSSDDLFYKHNPQLLQMAKRKDIFLLHNLCREELEKPDFYYVDYLAVVLHLLANLGAGGNHKILPVLEQIGVDERVIIKCFFSRNCSPHLKKRSFRH